MYLEFYPYKLISILKVMISISTTVLHTIEYNNTVNKVLFLLCPEVSFYSSLNTVIFMSTGELILLVIE